MAKYYVESGDLRFVVQADDARTAALWTMHLAMERSVSLDEGDWSAEQWDDLQALDVSHVAQFSRTMRVSEIGLGRNEAGEFDSLEIMMEWNQLATAMARLERLIDSFPSQP